MSYLIHEVIIYDYADYCCFVKVRFAKFYFLFSALPRFEPNRLQIFEYDTISVKCDGSDHASVDEEAEDGFNTSTGIFTISVAFVSDSEYWCERGNGTRSQSINK